MPEENQPEVVSRSTLRVALIHNNDAARLAHIRPVLAGVPAALADLCQVELTEISEQPPVVPQSWSLLIARRVVAWRLQRRWRRYREQPQYPLPLDLPRLPRDLWRSHDRTKAAIELLLSDKHAKAWRDFVQSGADLLMVLEDDALARDDTMAGLREMLALPDQRPIYLDLAGGFPRPDLGLARLEGKQVGRFLEHRKPVTNTAGGYLVNRALGRLLVGLMDEHPDWRLIPADWMLNRCFIVLEDRGVAVRCLHAVDPTIFIHGSLVGTYSSTTR